MTIVVTVTAKGQITLRIHDCKSFATSRATTGDTPMGNSDCS